MLGVYEEEVQLQARVAGFRMALSAAIDDPFMAAVDVEAMSMARVREEGERGNV